VRTVALADSPYKSDWVFTRQSASHAAEAIIGVQLTQHSNILGLLHWLLWVSVDAASKTTDMARIRRLSILIRCCRLPRKVKTAENS
jgi:hypothetical protein